MADSDIIKNFETSLNKEICLNCPFPNIENCFNCGFGPIISTNFYRSVLDLINRQKAEIEELQRKRNERGKNKVVKKKLYKITYRVLLREHSTIVAAYSYAHAIRKFYNWRCETNYDIITIKEI